MASVPLANSAVNAGWSNIVLQSTRGKTGRSIAEFASSQQFSSFFSISSHVRCRTQLGVVFLPSISFMPDSLHVPVVIHRVI